MNKGLPLLFLASTLIAPALTEDLCPKLKRCQSDATILFIHRNAVSDGFCTRTGDEEKREGWR